DRDRRICGLRHGGVHCRVEVAESTAVVPEADGGVATDLTLYHHGVFPLMRTRQAWIDVSQARLERSTAPRERDLAGLRDEVVVGIAPGTGLKGDVAQIERLNNRDALESIVTADSSLNRRASVTRCVHRNAEARRHGIPVHDAVLRGEV